MRHASFFSGVGGLDLGFERAGIKTVSVCEIDPYASSVLAERFPDAPNLGSITEINANDIPEADIWSGGFPCQDLSVAGKRAGFSGKRSSLAFTFLDLVEQRRPRWLVLENVPGLFTSNDGRDFARLLREMDELRYGVSWRTLDARFFGVPQRRRRVFIVASLESDRASQVLFECEGGCGHSQASKSSWQETADGSERGANVIGTLIAGLEKRTGTTQDRLYVGYGERVAKPEVAGALLARYHKGVSSTIDNHLVVGAQANANGMRATDGLAGRLDDQPVVAYQTRVDEKNNNFTLNQVDVANSLSALWPADTSHRSMTLVKSNVDETVISFPSRYSMHPTKFNDQTDPLTLAAGAPAVFRKSRRAQTEDDVETWVDDGLANTLNSFDVGDVRTTHAIVSSTGQEDNLLPEGLDSHRYRCCGNGVVANVAEWIGHRLVVAEREWNNG